MHITYTHRPFMIIHTWVTDGMISSFYPDCASSAFLIANLSGALINTNFVLDYPRLQPTTFLNIGGIQISERPNKLPKDLQDFLDGGGEHGVILFTMGFIFQPKAVPDHRIQAFFHAFASLPQRVIMKLDDLPHDTNLEVPPNVLLKPFLPQQDILAHKNVKLFITHCGMHGVMEAIYYQVPMVGMPVFIDQVLVISTTHQQHCSIFFQGDVLVRMEEKGIGFGIDKWAKKEELIGAINTVLGDKKYKENIKSLSELMKIGMKHRPMDDAIELLEYLAKTKGAHHLKLSSRYLNFFQYHSMDSYATIAIVIVAALKLVWIFCCHCRFKTKKKKSKED